MTRYAFSIFAVCALVLATGFGASGPKAGEPLAAPRGQVVLVVSGEIERTNAPGGVELDLAALKEFPARDIRTTTYWHEGIQHFKGVSAVAVLESLGMTGATLTATAEDDYTIEISLEELKAYDPIFALELNGADLQEEAEGPVWLIFPYDRMTAEERERYTAWSIWALQRIKVQD